MSPGSVKAASLHRRRRVAGGDDPNLSPAPDSDEEEDTASVRGSDPTGSPFGAKVVGVGAETMRIEVGLLGFAGLDAMLTDVKRVSVLTVPVKQRARPSMSLPL